MYCITCGEKLDDDARFCERCGTPNPACKPVTGIPGQDPAQNFQQGGQPYGQDFNQGYDQGFNQGGQYYNQNGAQGYGQEYDQNGQTYSPYMDNQQYDDPNVPPVYDGNPDYAVQEYESNADIEQQGRKVKRKGRKAFRTLIITAAMLGLISAVVDTVRNNAFDHDSVVVRTNDYIADDYDYDYDEPYYSFNSLNNFKNPGEVLWETDDVKVTANNVFHEGGYFSNAKVQIQVENKSSDEIKLSGEVAANGFQLDSSLLSDLIKPGKIDTQEFYIHIDALERVGIENIGEYSFWFSIQNIDYKPLASSDTVTVKTNNPESDKPVIDGYTVYNADGVSVTYSGIEENEYSGNDVYLYIENNTDQYMQFDVDDFSVNRYTMTPYLSNSEIHPGYGSMTVFNLNDDKLKDRRINDADDIDEIEFTLTGSDTQTHDKLFTSDVIKIEN